MAFPNRTPVLTFDPAQVPVIIVTWNPPDALEARLEAMTGSVRQVIIVDNGSAPDMLKRIAEHARVTVIRLFENRGIAAALNAGIRVAAASGADWVLLLDQDSTLGPEYLQQVEKTLLCHEESERVALVGGEIEEDVPGLGVHRWLRPHPWLPGLFEKKASGGRDLPDVTMVITSGSCLRISVWRELHGFDERLFIDGVDTEFCLRARTAGWRIAVSARAKLAHHLGRRQRHRLADVSFFPTHHSPVRHYFIARNRILLARHHAIRHVHWLTFEFAVALLWLFRVIAFESRKGIKLRAFVVGTWDGFRGKSGPCPKKRHEWLIV